ncbi:hypothetical protein M5689_002010 [Euphorbia peplus]|nr:hypothetical protein M5689_002010 [Euphorbia peplus]
MQVKPVKPDIFTFTIIIAGLIKEGLMDKAYKVFREMENNGCLPNRITYNIVLHGFLRRKDLSVATGLIREMCAKSFSADKTTLALIAKNDEITKTER